MKKRTVRLNEQDIERLVKKIIKEDDNKTDDWGNEYKNITFIISRNINKNNEYPMCIVVNLNRGMFKKPFRTMYCLRNDNNWYTEANTIETSENIVKHLNLFLTQEMEKIN